MSDFDSWRFLMCAYFCLPPRMVVMFFSILFVSTTCFWSKLRVPFSLKINWSHDRLASLGVFKTCFFIAIFMFCLVWRFIETQVVFYNITFLKVLILLDTLSMYIQEAKKRSNFSFRLTDRLPWLLYPKVTTLVKWLLHNIVAFNAK